MCEAKVGGVYREHSVPEKEGPIQQMSPSIARASAPFYTGNVGLLVRATGDMNEAPITRV